MCNLCILQSEVQSVGLSHIFTRIGARETAIKINNLAIEDDRAYLKDSGRQGMYPVK